MDDSREPTWVGQVLEFWFGELDEADWWTRNAAVDASIRERFLELHERLVATGCSGVREPRTVLASVIVLDQFSRNMFRGSPRAFAADPLARRVAREAIARGLDADMRSEERLFLYLPFEHSEDTADQALSVELIAALGREDWLRFAEAHKSLIDRFGRFPHRNEVLGRPSTPEEIAALKEPMSSF